MASTTLTMPEQWELLKDGFRRTFSDFKSKGAAQHVNLTKEGWMALQLYVYNFCAAPGRQPAQDGGAGAKLGGKELYDTLQAFLKERCDLLLKNSGNLTGEAVLEYFTREWEQYMVSSKCLNHICNYLNRFWVKRERDEGNQKVYEVYELTLVVWRDVIFRKLKDQLVDAVLGMIQRERCGETINNRLISSVRDCFVQLGLRHEETGVRVVSSLDVYKEALECPYLRTAEQFYKTESQEFVAKNSVVDYLVKVETRLGEEMKRVQMYLHTTSRDGVAKTCETVMIKNHLTLLHQEFKVLLVEDRVQDLKRLYSLLKRVDDALEPLRTKLEEHIEAKGLAAIEKSMEGDTENFKGYVDTLLAVHQQYAKLVASAFENDPTFVASLDKACRKFVNENAYTEGGKKSSRSPELLAKFCDSFLKTSSKNPEDDELESLINNIMIVFKYIDEKDVFQKFYSKMLAKRLVNFTSANEDAERSMISKLKTACGYEYTSKLQRMFNDVGVSKDLHQKFKVHLETAPLDCDFSVQVLTNGSWPFQTGQDMILPTELTKCIDRFTAFYSKEHQGRKLAWLFQISKGELKTNYTKKQSYYLQSSTVQMVILLQFNDALEYTATDLVARTGTKQAEFLQNHLEILVKMKLLDQSEDRYSLNTNYKYKKTRVKIDQPVKSETKAESEQTHKTVEEDRNLVIQACIVRIMKMRKRLKHMLLIDESIAQLSARFKPKIPMIKKCIDMLIEKEYLCRTEGSRDEYDYMA